MPQRLLRPALRQSKRWNRCPFIAQSLYVRLLMLVDDYGRYEADPELLRSEAFPYGDENGNLIDLQTFDRGLLALASSDMLFLYESEGKVFLQLKRWQERARSESKFPDPKECKMLSIESKCRQMIASPPSPSPSPSPSPTAEPIAVPASPTPPPSTAHAAFIDGWVQSYKVRFGFDYVFDGGRDGKAVKELLRMNILAIDLLEIAKKAWKKVGQSPKSFNCEQSTTIHGFKAHFNQIRTEITNTNSKHVSATSAPDRNAGTHNAGRIGQYDNIGKVK